ncbi:MAG: hypothetical protein BEU01_01615 [Marine Group III euryarchaeote CG-Epi4]|uniref:rRNA small subunit methyltransferase F RNA-binding PUA-like domain-containing protein n=1 Tax=Marine Group III euryarchaeote CG-Epi4 TaxID=1888998 RepID=A0A1J5THR6_9ARCH|nr:MAG: hypothetical protein BEU01_01615 [Marine Group III euryarchaeote CG-Epi4]
MLNLLHEDKKEILIQYCHERFGIGKKIFKEYRFYEGSKNKIYLIKKLLKLRIIPESSGLCIFRFDKTPKPTTNFLQLFSSDISKSILDIDELKLIDYCNGNDLEVSHKFTNVDPGFVAIRYNGNIIGCGHWNKIIVRNQLPKSRRCKIKYW